ncbi:MAG: tetratricopeptide repeat protein, partial [Acidobacteria bacterium]|nr:tetratricopeptide repeat protein [Acidobacteriota bacterium]
AAGLVLAAGRLRAPAGPLAALATAWALTPVLFFNTARFRLPAILLLLPLAAAGWAAARPAAGDRRRAGLAAGAALLVLAVGIATFPAHPQLPPSEELNLADVADQAGREADALAWRRRAVERDPRDPLARIRLADTLRVGGRCDEALAHYAAVTERDDLAAEWRLAAIRSTARCLVALGRPAQAVDWYERFLAADPDQPRTGTRPDFHLRGVPPLQACRIRIELAEALAHAGRDGDAAAELARVVTDCAESDRLAQQAQSRLRARAADGPGDGHR